MYTYCLKENKISNTKTYYLHLKSNLLNFTKDNNIRNVLNYVLKKKKTRKNLRTFLKFSDILETL